ncbi:MAG: hypothetical protein VZQ49_00100 [Methanobrevibacter sp.]|nr:hypothetical protein [Methanobrevibacter sp.]
MANKVNVTIDANVEGYVQGIDQATQSAEKYETETRKISDATGNFRKDLAAAKKEVMNLAQAYNKLDAEAKKSAFGKEMARQLEEAKTKAAEYIDLQGDLQAELKNMASDTHTLDMLSEGMGVFADVTAGALGVVAQFTGNEKDAQKAIVAFTTAQSILSGVTKIQNALQMQSNTMMAVTKVQTLAAAAAERVKTAATTQGVVATKAASVAQAAFNAVAYANPYVLLAMAITGVVAALASFIIFSGRAADAEEDEQKAAERNKAVKDAYYNSYNEHLSTTMSNYTKLQNEWKNLKSEGEKNEWIKDNSDAFHELGFEIASTGDAEKLFVENEAAVIKSFVARAEAAALAAQQVEIFNQALNDMPQVGESKSAEWFAQNGLSTKGRKDTNTGFMRFEYQYEFTEQDRQKLIQDRLAAARESSEKLAKLQLDAEKKANKAAADVGVATWEKERNKKLTRAGKTAPKTKVEIEIEEGSLAESEAELKKLEELRTKMSIDNPDLPRVKAEIERVKKEISDKKIQLGLELPKTDLDTMSEYEKSLKKAVENAKAAYVVEWLQNPNSDKLNELYEGWERATEAADKYSNAVKAQFEGVTVTKNEDLTKAFNTDPKSVEEYQKAISTLESHLNSVDISSMGEGGSKTFEQYIERIQELKAELEPLKENLEDAMLTPLEKAQKKMQQTANDINSVGQAVQAAGELFSALGEVADDDGLKVAGIVAKAVATVALSFAQALTTAKTWVDWLAFGITGLATMVTMISQIKSVTSGGYAQGGIIPGSSYSGDRLTARVNSGEMILNQRQQKNLFNMLDQGAMPSANGTNVTVTGVVRGTDLLLVQKNTSKVMKKAGNTINF